MRKIMSCIVVIFLCVITGCSSSVDTDSPKEMTEAYLEQMKEGDFESASEFSNVVFDKKAYEKVAPLQKDLMKITYNNMNFKVIEESEDGERATVKVKVSNINYIETLNEASFQSLKKKGKDEDTKKIYKDLMKKTKPTEKTVIVNYIKKNKTWKFDGSNSVLQAAMLGY